MNTLAEWQGYIGFWEEAQNLISAAVPWTPVLLIAATLFEFIGGLLVLLGIRERFGASLLILAIIPITIIMHPFWFVEDPSRQMDATNFLKNMAILGGLMMILLRDEPDTGSVPMNFGG